MNTQRIKLNEEIVKSLQYNSAPSANLKFCLLYETFVGILFIPVA